ncbi:sulfite exporter TauE/SafE family protein [Streptomyces meridianus]|uniref:Probable membrane transporter protein n=1 Tax=Streptomyces meridianus TaxID=2938945 RepID=A0ABT0XC28_9ACTN|nr:sulfite exporter TauE/SafE family protein [Streptomyces meridianus]MCM2580056.1 sulfite exporter TauE/SafE family protein [Streptomyces meridianus]
MSDPGTLALMLLALCGFAAGVGITAVGPGGVLVTVGLFALAGQDPARVAGTAMVTNLATGVLATAAYTRSGQLREAGTRRTALVLCGAAVAGTPLGVLLNSLVPGRVFGVLLGVFVALVAGLVWWRHRIATESGPAPAIVPGLPATGAVGVGVAVVSGMFGLGGPVLTVPLLVALHLPMLSALAASQAQSVVIAGVGTAGYAAHGAVDWTLAAVVGVPELAGVLVGWVLARALPARVLRLALVATLLALAPYLVLHG